MTVKTEFTSLSFSQNDSNGDPDEVQLDAEMEKVFAGTIRDKDKFDVSQLTGSGDSSGATTPLKFHDKDAGGKFAFAFD